MPTLNLFFTGDQFQGPPTASVSVDGGTPVTFDVPAVHGQDAPVAHAVALAPGKRVITIAMTNDVYGGAPDKDRNLYVAGATLDTVDLGIVLSLFDNSPQSFHVDVPQPAPVPAPAPPVDHTADILAAIRDFRTDVDAGLAGLLAAIKAIPSAGAPMPAPAPSPAPSGPALNTAFPAGWTALTVTPADSLPAAIAAAAPHFVLTLAPGTYTQVMAPSVPGTIRSASGNPHDTILDGGGGLPVNVNNGASSGTPGRLAFGKGVIHVGADVDIEGLTITGGGSNAGGHDGQAAIYFEGQGFASTVRNCILDHNENGAFANNGNVNVVITFDTCLFTRNGCDEESHDVYLSGGAGCEVHFKNCIAPGSNYGNDFKTRVPVVSIDGCWLGSQNANRVYECADGAALSVSNTTLVGNDIGQNFAGNGTESTSKGAGNTVWDKVTVYAGRNQDLANAGTFTATNCKTFFESGNSSLYNSKGTALTGLTLHSPDGVYTPLPSAPAFRIAG